MRLTHGRTGQECESEPVTPLASVVMVFGGIVVPHTTDMAVALESYRPLPDRRTGERRRFRHAMAGRRQRDLPGFDAMLRSAIVRRRVSGETPAA